MNELDVLKDVILKLDSLNVPYMLTGSMAMIYYAQPRMTRDIDIVIELSPNGVDNFVSSFEKEYYISKDSVRDSISSEFLFNIIQIESSVKIDCIIRKNDEYRKTEFLRRKKVQYAGISLYIVSKEDLIISKLYWAKDSKSELQIRDIKNLMNSDYDNEYLSIWIEKLQLETIYREMYG